MNVWAFSDTGKIREFWLSAAVSTGNVSGGSHRLGPQRLPREEPPGLQGRLDLHLLPRLLRVKRAVRGEVQVGPGRPFNNPGQRRAAVGCLILADLFRRRPPGLPSPEEGTVGNLAGSRGRG